MLTVITYVPGLEITRVASQFALQYISVAMQLRFCIAVGCDAKSLKPQMVGFIYYFFESSQVFNRLSQSRERILSVSRFPFHTGAVQTHIKPCGGAASPCRACNNRVMW
jgi:hypothetical protein